MMKVLLLDLQTCHACMANHKDRAGGRWVDVAVKRSYKNKLSRKLPGQMLDFVVDRVVLPPKFPMAIHN